MRTEQTLSPTASFWLENLERFDPHHVGPQWERPVRSLIEPTLQGDDQLTGLVSEAIVIQQFLLEVITRRGLSRASVVTQLRRLLASQPFPTQTVPARQSRPRQSRPSPATCPADPLARPAAPTASPPSRGDP